MADRRKIRFWRIIIARLVTATIVRRRSLQHFSCPNLWAAATFVVSTCGLRHFRFQDLWVATSFVRRTDDAPGCIERSPPLQGPFVNGSSTTQLLQTCLRGRLTRVYTHVCAHIDTHVFPHVCMYVSVDVSHISTNMFIRTHVYKHVYTHF